MLNKTVIFVCNLDFFFKHLFVYGNRHLLEESSFPSFLTIERQSRGVTTLGRKYYVCIKYIDISTVYTKGGGRKEERKDTKIEFSSLPSQMSLALCFFRINKYI